MHGWLWNSSLIKQKLCITVKLFFCALIIVFLLKTFLFGIVDCRMTKVIVKRQFSPWLYKDYIYYLSPLGREQVRLQKFLHSFTNQVSGLIFLMYHMTLSEFLVNSRLYCYGLMGIFSHEIIQLQYQPKIFLTHTLRTFTSSCR